MDSDDVREEVLSVETMVELLAIGVIVIPCRDKSSKGWATSSERWVPAGTCRSVSPNLIRET